MKLVSQTNADTMALSDQITPQTSFVRNFDEYAISGYFADDYIYGHTLFLTDSVVMLTSFARTPADALALADSGQGLCQGYVGLDYFADAYTGVAFNF